MKIKARLGTGQTLDIDIQTTDTVLTLKNSISTISGISVNEIRLIFGGRILQENDAQLLIFNLQENSVVHVGKTAKPLVAAAPKKLQKPSFQQAMLQDPLVKRMLSNPEYMRNILMNDPRYKQLLEKNPEIGNQIMDPNFLETMGKAAENPEYMQEMMRNQDRAISNIESMPGGFTELSSIFKSIDNNELEDPSTPEANIEMARRLGVSSPSKDKPNTTALPNPWAPIRNNSPMYQAMNPFGAFGMSSAMLGNQFENFGGRPINPIIPPPGYTSAPTANPFPFSNTNLPVDNIPAQERYRTQLQTLHSMGFTNDEQNVRALLAAGGNTEAAIAYILDQ